MKIHTLLLLVSLFAATSTEVHADSWKNPFTLEGQAGGGVADPFVFKFKGVYYMYCTGDASQVLCWQSRDLVNWSQPTVCCNDAVAVYAYAPEVKYWNGKFYMVSSPSGNGHYVLTSDSPTGPFVRATANLGYEIDGNIFIDDDGKWYFYHANGGGIRGSLMPSSTSFGSDMSIVSAMAGQWTEGPEMFKHNGKYYLLYCGNHYLSRGYRTNLAVSAISPLSGFEAQAEQNPFLVSSDGIDNFYGLGHGSVVIGPDLDTYYFCYHNINLTGGANYRYMNIDRMGWNGDKLMIYGPTTWEQTAPAVADNDYFDREEIGTDWTFDGGEWSIVSADHLAQTAADKSLCVATKTDKSYSGDFTAEFTLRLNSDEEQGRFGAVYASDGLSRRMAFLNSATKQLELVSEEPGKSAEKTSYDLVGDFDAHAWHSVKVMKRGSEVRIFVDELLRATVTDPDIAGNIGYAADGCKADFAYIAANDSPADVNFAQTALPVPSVIAAPHASATSASVGDLALRYGTAHYLSMNTGDNAVYSLNPRLKSPYHIGLRYRAASAATVSLKVNGETAVTGISLPATKNSAWNVFTVNNVALSKGNATLEITVDEGSLDLYELNVRTGVANPKAITDDFSGTLTKNWKHTEGTWTINDGVLKSPAYGKIISGGTSYLGIADFTAEADVSFSGNINGGIIFRVNNPAYGGAGTDASAGSDFLQGYFFGLSSTGAVLGKQNYNWTQLASKNMTITTGKTYHLKVEAAGNTYKCYVDDMSAPVITYTDALPFISGRVGFRTHNSTATFDNFVLTPASDTSTGIVYPSENGVSDGTETVEAFTVYGVKVGAAHSRELLKAMLPKGIYIIKGEGKTDKVVLQ